MRGVVRFAGFAVLAAAVAVLAAGAALEFLVPKERLRALCVEKLQARLRREVKIASVSVGPWRGLRVEGLAISEAPRFEAGTFLEAERLTVRVKYWPLLAGKVAVDQVLLLEPRIKVIRERGGRYNFTEMLEAPAPGAVTVPPLTTGWDDPSRKLAELGLSAAAGAAAAATKLDVDIQRLRVRRGEAQYIDFEAGYNVALTGVSVWAEGLAARAKTDANVDFRLQGSYREQPLESEVSSEVRMELDPGFYPSVSAGHVLLSKIRHPNFKTERVRVDWDLRGLSPDLLTAQGVVRLEGSPGELVNPAFIARQGRWPGLLLYPVEVLAKFRGLGLPDMLSLPYSELRGEYSLGGGSVNLAPLYLRGPVVSINAEGVVNLAKQTVGLKANIVLGKSSVGVQIQGPMAAPAVTGDLAFREASRKPVAAPGKPKPARQRKEALEELDAAFEDAEEPKARKGRPATTDANRRNTLKDAESLIDAPLPDE